MDTELERLVATLVTEVSGYVKGMEEAQRLAQETAQKVEQQSKNIEKFSDSLKEAADTAVSAIAALGMGAWLKGSMGLFSTQEESVIRLEAALKAAGDTSLSSSKDFQAFASEMQGWSRVGDEATNVVLAQAVSYGVMGEKAKKATKEALALATISKSSSEAMLRITTAMAKGDTKTAMMFSRMVPQLRGIKNELQFVAKYQALVDAGMETEIQLAQTASGQLTQMGNAWGDLREQMGEFVAIVAGPLAKAMKTLTEKLQAMPDWAKAATVGIMGLGAALVSTSVALAIFPKLWAGITAGWALVTAAMGKFIVVNGALGAGLALTTAGVVALTAGLVALGAYLGTELVWRLSGGKEALEDFNRAMAEGEELSNKLLSRTNKRMSEELGKALEIEDPAEKLSALKGLLENTEKNLLGVSSSLGAARKEAESAGESILDNPLFSGKDIPYFGKGLEVESEAAGRHVKEIKSLYDSTSDHAARLKEEIDKLEESMSKPDPKIAKTVKKLNEDLDEQIATLRMTSEEIETYRLRRMGATEADISAIASKKELAAAGKKAVDAERSLKSLIESMKMDIATTGMSSEEKKIYELSLEDTSDAMMRQAKALLFIKNGMEEHNRMFERGTEILRKYMTPEQKMQEQITELDKLLANGIFTEEQYSFALERVKEEFGGVAEMAEEARNEVMNFDAALAGGAEAQRRITAYLDTLSQPGVTSRAMAGPAPLMAGRDPASQQAVVTALGTIAGILGDIRDKPGLVVTAAEIE